MNIKEVLCNVMSALQTVQIPATVNNMNTLIAINMTLMEAVKQLEEDEHAVDQRNDDHSDEG